MHSTEGASTAGRASRHFHIMEGQNSDLGGGSAVPGSVHRGQEAEGADGRQRDGAGETAAKANVSTGDDNG